MYLEGLIFDLISSIIETLFIKIKKRQKNKLKIFYIHNSIFELEIHLIKFIRLSLINIFEFSLKILKILNEFSLKIKYYCCLMSFLKNK